MPKRTNDFQKLITTIYEQITPEGGRVTESGMVFDRDAKTLREVDILVEYRYAHHDFRLMIECRDRSRKDSVEWIDGLIGKSGSLDVDKIVAVSKEGFTQAALEKAQAHGIAALTVEEAVETDWGKYPIKPGVAVVSGEKYRLHDVMFKDGGEFRSLKELGLDSLVVNEGAEIGAVKDICEYFFREFLVPKIDEKVKAQFLDIFKTKEDLSKTLYVEIDHTFVGFYVRLNDGKEIEISSLKFIVYGTRWFADVEQAHMKFNEMMVSSGKHVDSDGSILKFSVVQDPEAKKIHGKWQRVPPDES